MRTIMSINVFLEKKILKERAVTPTRGNSCHVGVESSSLREARNKDFHVKFPEF